MYAIQISLFFFLVGGVTAILRVTDTVRLRQIARRTFGISTLKECEGEVNSTH